MTRTRREVIVEGVNGSMAHSKGTLLQVVDKELTRSVEGVLGNLCWYAAVRLGHWLLPSDNGEAIAGKLGLIVRLKP
jgi:hypothetical protein